MNRKERAILVGTILDDLFPNPTPPLNHSSPFTLLIATLLSAVCSDERVNTVTPALFALADTPETMAALPVATIQNIIRPCGLSRRKALAIRLLSEEIVKNYSGHVPPSQKKLESLPGVGHKTAAVVMAQAFHSSSFPVDRHILRSAKRWGLSSHKTVSAIERDLKLAFPKKLWSKRHLQIILFARQFCKARTHVISSCPICSKLRNF